MKNKKGVFGAITVEMAVAIVVLVLVFLIIGYLAGWFGGTGEWIKNFFRFGG